MIFFSFSLLCYGFDFWCSFDSKFAHLLITGVVKFMMVVV